MAKRRLLVIGLCMAGSGLARLMRELMRGLEPGLVLRVVGVVPMGSCEVGATVEGLELHPYVARSQFLDVDAATLRRHVAEFSPDDILVIGPAFITARLLERLQSARGDARLIFYCPIEGEPTDKVILRAIALTDLCLVYTHAARDGLLRLSRHHAIAIPPIRVVGHGIDTATFRRVSDEVRCRIRCTMFADRSGRGEPFVVLNANRGYIRKRIDLTIESFALFADGKSEAILYLHVPGLDAQTCNDLKQRIAASGVQDQVLLNPTGSEGAMSDEQLNALYNGCDVGLTTAMGEGWGLATFEHAATGAPQVVPRHTSFAENWDGAAVLVAPSFRQESPFDFSTMHIVSPGDVAVALDRLYRDSAHRLAMGQAAQQRALQPRFNWQTVTASLIAALDETL